MRVAMVSLNYWPGPQGGAERQCRIIAKQLSHYGVSSYILTARRNQSWPQSERFESTQILRLSCFRKYHQTSEPVPVAQVQKMFPKRQINRFEKFLNDLSVSLDIVVFMLALARTLRSHRFDILHVHSSTGIAGYCCWLGKRLGIPVVIKETSFPAFRVLEPLVPFRRVWDKWRRRAYCVAQHEATAESLVEQGISSDLIRVIANGVQMPSLSERDEDDHMVLYVGNISQGIEDKGLDVLIESWAQVYSMSSDLRLYIAGSGDSTVLRKMARAYSCESSISLLGHVADVTAYYRKATLLLLPSRREGMSNVLLEAMSWGIPVVASDIPGNRAVVQHAETGMLTPVGEPDAMAKAIQRLVNDKGSRTRFGKQAHLLISAKYEISVVARELKAFYDYAIGHR